MKVLWIVSFTLPEAKYLLSGDMAQIKTTGGWIQGGADALKTCPGIDFVVASIDPSVKELTVLIGDRVTYYLVPCPKGSLKYDKRQETYWREIKERVNPDVIHIHGTEYAHSLAFLNACGPERVAVSLQGMKSAIWPYYNYGLGPCDLTLNLTPRDLILGTMRREQRQFRKSGKMELDVIMKTCNVIGRTSWDKARTWAVNPSARYYFCGETLRSVFYDECHWSYDNCSKHSIFLSQAGYALKGLHQVLKAMPLVLRYYPDAKIRVSGWDITAAPWYRIHGYGKYIKRLIARYDLQSCVSFIGYLDAEEMKNEYLSSNVFICPSSIENSPNSLGEAQILGVPCIASYVGGVMDMMVGNEDNLYRFEEVEMLAQKICAVFERGGAQVDMSETARCRHDPGKNSQDLIEIYQDIIDSDAGK